MKLTLTPKSNPQLDAFMVDYRAGTTANPFSGRERVWENQAAIELSVFSGRIHLSSIRSFEKGKKSGSGALDFICGLADKHGVEIDCDAVPFGDKDMSEAQLTQWYKSRGFARAQDYEELVRQPKTASTDITPEQLTGTSLLEYIAKSQGSKLPPVDRDNPNHHVSYTLKDPIQLYHYTPEKLLPRLLHEGIRTRKGKVFLGLKDSAARFVTGSPQGIEVSLPSGVRLWDNNFEADEVYVTQDIPVEWLRRPKGAKVAAMKYAACESGDCFSHQGKLIPMQPKKLIAALPSEWGIFNSVPWEVRNKAVRLVQTTPGNHLATIRDNFVKAGLSSEDASVAASLVVNTYTPHKFPNTTPEVTIPTTYDPAKGIGPVYHGSDKKFKKFDYGTIGNNGNRGYLGAGFYFSGSKDVASSYGKVKAFHLDVHNPFVIDEPLSQEAADALNEITITSMFVAGETTCRTIHNALATTVFEYPEFADELTAYLESKGYDALFYNDFQEVVAFSSDVITPIQEGKTADGPAQDQNYDDSITQTPAFKAWFGASKVVDDHGRPLRVYHGTRESFESFDPSKATPTALYGPGLYFTASPEVASGNGKHTDPQDIVNAAVWNQAGYAWQGSQWELQELTKQQMNYAKRLMNTNSYVDDAWRDIGTRQNRNRGLEALAQGEPAFRKWLANEGPKDIRMKLFKETEKDPKLMATRPQTVAVFLKIVNPFYAESNMDKATAVKIFGEGKYITQIFGTLTERRGSDVYEAGAYDLGSKVKANEALQRAGYDGIQHTGGRILGTVEHPVWIAFEPNQVKSAIGNSGNFDPSDHRITAAEETSKITRTIIPAEETKHPGHSSITESPEFRTWFKDSEVVDSAGKPLPVYHGTRGNFEEFDEDNQLIFFSEEPGFANAYAGGDSGANVLPCYLSVQALFDYRTSWEIAHEFWYSRSGYLDEYDLERLAADYYELLPEELTEEQTDAYGEEQFVSQIKQGSWVALEIHDFLHWLREEGFDGLVLTEAGHINFAVFDSKQVKSAIGNNGKFDPKQRKITGSIWDREPDEGDYKKFEELKAKLTFPLTLYRAVTLGLSGLDENGVGAAWGLEEKDAVAYYGNNKVKPTIIRALINDESAIDWDGTFLQNVEFHWSENEVRLKSGSPIKITGIMEPRSDVWKDVEPKEVTASVASNGLVDWTKPVEGLTISLNDLNKADRAAVDMVIDDLPLVRGDSKNPPMDLQVPVRWMWTEAGFHEQNHDGPGVERKVGEIMELMKKGKKFGPALYHRGHWLDGNHRIKAARALGINDVPAINLADFTPGKREKETALNDELLRELEDFDKTAAHAWTQEEMIREADGHRSACFTKGEPGYAKPQDLFWKHEEKFNLNKIDKFSKGWYDDLAQELQDRVDEGESSQKYVDALTQAVKNGTTDVIVVAEGTDGSLYIWDGNHRVGLAHVAGVTHLPAIVGYREVGKTAAELQWDKFREKEWLKANLSDAKKGPPGIGIEYDSVGTPGGSAFWVTRNEDGKPIAFICFDAKSIFHIGVLPKYRGQGIASELIEAVEAKHGHIPMSGPYTEDGEALANKHNGKMSSIKLASPEDLEYLKSYLTMTDAEKGEEVARNQVHHFKEWIEENHEELSSIFPEDEDDYLDDYSGFGPEVLAEYLGNGGSYYMQNDPADAPTFLHMEYVRDVQDEWLVHFTDYAEGVAYSGFTLGVDDISKLGLTTYFKNDGSYKKHGGYNFAYAMEDFKRYHTGDKYGSECVVFRASGIEVYHFGDSEPQVIFWGKDAVDLVPVVDYDGMWAVKNPDDNEIMVSEDELGEVVNWIVNHHQLYFNKEERKKVSTLIGQLEEAREELYECEQATPQAGSAWVKYDESGKAVAQSSYEKDGYVLKEFTAEEDKADTENTIAELKKFIAEAEATLQQHGISKTAAHRVGDLFATAWTETLPLIREKFLFHNDREKSRVQDLMQELEAGEELPPILVLDKGGKYLVMDGNHRLQAALNLKRPEIEAYVVEWKDLKKVLDAYFEGDFPHETHELDDYILLGDDSFESYSKRASTTHKFEDYNVRKDEVSKTLFIDCEESEAGISDELLLEIVQGMNADGYKLMYRSPGDDGSEGTYQKMKIGSIPTLYHGTCRESADLLLANGFTPKQVGPGGNMGQSRYLYVTNIRENAEWFANEKGCDVVLEVVGVPSNLLRVDPEDGIAATVEEDLNNPSGLPGNLVITGHLPAQHFKEPKAIKTAYIAPKEGIVALAVDLGPHPVATLTLDLGIPNFTIFSIKIPIDGVSMDEVKFFIEQAFEAMLDEVSAFMLTMQYPEPLVVSVYKLALDCFEKMTIEDASDFGTDADDNIRFYEASFDIPDGFAEATLGKVVTASTPDIYEPEKTCIGTIPEIKFLPLSVIHRREMDFLPEVTSVSDEVAASMDYSEPVDVTAFRYSQNHTDTDPEVTLSDGHHRYAAASQTGKPWLPVNVRAINAKGVKINALIALSREIERGRGTVTASATQRLPPTRHWNMTTVKPTPDNPARTIQMYKNRSLKALSRPYFLMLYDRRGAPVGVAKVPKNWEERLTKAL